MNTEKIVGEIDLMENAVYIVKDGKLTLVDTPPKVLENRLLAGKLVSRHTMS